MTRCAQRRWQARYPRARRGLCGRHGWRGHGARCGVLVRVQGDATGVDDGMGGVFTGGRWFERLVGLALCDGCFRVLRVVVWWLREFMCILMVIGVRGDLVGIGFFEMFRFLDWDIF